MKKHVTIAAFVVALAAYSPAQNTYRDSQDSRDQVAAQSDAKLSKKDRKKLEKEEKKEQKQEREQEKHAQKKQADEQHKQYKEQEKQVAKERRHEQKDQEKQVASERKKDEKYERKEAERAEKSEARDMHRHIEREARAERASAAPAPRYVLPRIPISHTATPGLLLAQREVSRTIYSQLPSSDVRVLLQDGNQIVLSGSAPSPSWRQRLLQLAMGAAHGYSIVDQLAANFVGDAAGAATSAAIGGVSDLIHGSGAKDSGPPSGYAPPPPDSAAPAPLSSQQSLPNSDADATTTSLLDPGSNACVNLANSSQVLLTGQVASQPSADLIRRFARQLASPSAVVTDQLAVRTTGVPSAANAPQDVAGTSGAGTTASANPAPTVMSSGSTVCVTENNGEVFLTGTVGSTADLGTVENAVQPLVGKGRLVDHIIGSMNSATQIAASAPVDNSAATPAAQQTEVEQAVHSIPRLANVNVQVSADGVHLSGSVDTTQDDQMAADIVRQYVAARSVVDNLEVANRTQPTPQ
jgi:osmotically-inducible protein OsmY